MVRRVSQFGSSPRGRGTLAVSRRMLSPPESGSSPRGRGTHLPASPSVVRTRKSGSSPRGRGTLLGQYVGLHDFHFGSSPRGRGTRLLRAIHRTVSTARIIPAWAGNALDALPTSPTSGRGGSSPRGRGTRGNLPRGQSGPRRIIPAWAGNANQGLDSPPAGQRPDHPRVGGERVRRRIEA